jgi:hypothetical protein
VSTTDPDPVPSSPAPRGGAVGTGRILQSVGTCTAILLAAQTFGGHVPWVGVIAFAAIAALMFGLYLDVLRSVRTAVVLLLALTAACTLGTLTVQRSQIGAVDEDEYRSTLAFAWAHLAVKLTHPIPREAELPETHAQHLDRVATAFGDAVGDEERHKAEKSLLAAEDEAAARMLAAAAPWLFAGALYHLANGLRFTDLFVAWWFIGLFFLLSANLLVGAVMRRRPSVRNLGFHGAHLGLVLVVTGATAGAFVGQRGVMPLNVGEQSAQFIEQEPMLARPMGFSVQLDRFETWYHEDLFIEVIDAGQSEPHAAMAGSPHGAMGGAQPLRHTEKLELGKELLLTDPTTSQRWTLTMEEIASGGELQRVFTPGEGDAAIRLEFREADAPEGRFADLWIGAGDPIWIDPANRFKLRVQRVDEPGHLAEGRLGTGCPAGDVSGSLLLTREGAGTLVAPVIPGGEAEFDGVTIRFEEVIPDFRVGDENISPLDFPRNPALRARIEGPDGHGGDFLFFADPRLQGFTTLPWEGYEATFEYDFWCSPTRARVLLAVLGPGNAVAAVDAEGTEPLVPLAEGMRMDIPAGVGSLSITEILTSADERTELVIPEQGDTTSGHTALRLRIDGPNGSEQRWLLSNSADGATLLQADEDATTGFALLLADNKDRPPRDWRSHLSFLDEGQVTGNGTIEVNQPSIFHGYRFFQSDADPRRPDYSGLQVVHDPSWPLVQAGLWMLLLGISWCFYVQPLFDRRRRTREGAP